MANAAHLTERADALADIQEDGQALTLYVSNPDPAPAWDPDYNADTGTTIYALTLEHDIEFGDSRLTLQDTQKLMVAQSPDALSIEPGDEILYDDGNKRTVVTASPFAPGGTIIFWDVVCARG